MCLSPFATPSLTNVMQELKSMSRTQAALKHSFPKHLGPFALVKTKRLALWIDRAPRPIAKAAKAEGVKEGGKDRADMDFKYC